MAAPKRAILEAACRSGDAKPAFRIVDVAALIEERTGVRYSISGAHRLMKTMGLSYQKIRPTHLKADPQARERFKKTLPRRLKRIAKEQANGRTVELWFQDEARVGQVGRTGRVWYERGVRPRGLRDMRHEAAWLFGAICPERDTGVALVLPEASVPAMQALIDELASQLPPDRHAVLVMDRAGRHIARDLDWPDTITSLHLPPYSPELNPIERVWLYLRERFLSHRLVNAFDAIVDACCDAWNNLLAENGRIASLGGHA